MNFAAFSAVGSTGTHFVTTGGQLPVTKIQQNVSNNGSMPQVKCYISFLMTFGHYHNTYARVHSSKNITNSLELQLYRLFWTGQDTLYRTLLVLHIV